MTPGRKFSITTCEIAASFLKISLPSGDLRLIVTDCLPALTATNEMPINSVIHFHIRAQAPGEISVFRVLDLDDFGSQQNELKAAERACEDVGYVQHADTMEWKRHLFYPVVIEIES